MCCSKADVGTSPELRMGAAKMSTLGNTLSGTQGLGGAKKQEIEEYVTVVLTETHTETMLSLPSFVFASDIREIAAVDERNAKYEAVVAAHKVIYFV